MTRGKHYSQIYFQDIQSTNGSVEDLNLAVGANPTFNMNDTCCSCSIM